MRELERKQEVRKKLYSVPALAALALLTLLVIRGTWKVVQKMEESRGYVKNLQSEVALMQDRRQKLETSIAKLETEQGLESEIKGKFSVKKEGEQVAIIVDARESSSTPPPVKGSWLDSVWKTVKSLWQ